MDLIYQIRDDQKIKYVCTLVKSLYNVYKHGIQSQTAWVNPGSPTY